MSSDPNNAPSTIVTSGSSSTASALEEHLKVAAQSSEQEFFRKHQEADRLNQEAQRLNNEAEQHEQVSTQAKRLRDEANQIVQKEKRLRTESKDANRLRKSLEFEALCLALRRNDASTTTVTRTMDFPTGYAQKLGTALDGNTHVEKIDICVPKAIAPVVDGAGQVSKSETLKSVAPFVRFLGAGESLRQVNVSGVHTKGWRELLLVACCRNPKLEKLFIGNMPGISAGVFSNLKFATSLHTLDIFLRGVVFDSTHQLLVQDAFRLLSSLTNLSVRADDSNNASELLESIFAGLRNGACKLDKLMLSPQAHVLAPQLWPALSTLLQCMGKVQHLYLHIISFSAQSMGELVIGLQNQGDAATTSLTTVSKLTLSYCNLDGDARRLLRAFMHTRADSTTASSLEVLGIFDSEDLTAKDLVSMLSMRPKDDQSEVAMIPDFYHTIGSRIKSLWVQPVNSIDGFLPRLAKYGHRVCLEALRVLVDDPLEIMALARCMAKVGSLRELHVIGIEEELGARPIIRALKANGNIQRMSFEFDQDDDASFEKEHDNVITRLAAAYCERNKLLDGLLLESSRGADEDGQASPADESVVEKQKKKQCPALLQATQQIPTTKASKVLRTLMRFQESIGY